MATPGRKTSTTNGPGPGGAARERIVRITVVGDGYTGKTCMLIVYKDKVYNDKYIPTVFDSYSMNLTVDGVDNKVILQDTAGQEDYDKLRTFAYKDTDAFLLCYAVDKVSSYEHVSKWYKEIKYYNPSAKVILVATKIDVREDSDALAGRNRYLNFEHGRKMKEKIGACDFLECSSKKLFNVDKVFQTAVLAVLKPTRKKDRRRKDCVIV